MIQRFQYDKFQHPFKITITLNFFFFFYLCQRCFSTKHTTHVNQHTPSTPPPVSKHIEWDTWTCWKIRADLANS